MPEITLETSRIKQIEDQISVNIQEINDLLGVANEHVEQACVRAWETGKLLLEAKPLQGHGNFMEWCKRFPQSLKTLERYMAVARKFDTVTNLPECMHDLYLAVGIVPEKQKIQHDGNVLLKPANHYLSFINRWSFWWKQVKIGKVEFDKEQVKKELKPLKDWIDEIYGDVPIR